LLSKEDIPEVEEFEDNYPMHFKEPQELIQVFANLEESNLFLVQMTQQNDQDL
jgi:alpha-amylase/alpha-mannosidase (GH57 family)